MLTDNLKDTVDYWIGELDRYDFEMLFRKPAENSWSLGQVYMHLIENAAFYIEQIEICLSGNHNAEKESSPIAKSMFLHNELPNELIEGPSENQQTKQPQDKEYLSQSLLHFKKSIEALASQIESSIHFGKTKHPGLHYFGAKDWIQFADMHFRHHQRQKKRIDAWLDMQKSSK